MNQEIKEQKYKITWSFPSKRTIDRRVNEACEHIEKLMREKPCRYCRLTSGKPTNWSVSIERVEVAEKKIDSS